MTVCVCECVRIFACSRAFVSVNVLVSCVPVHVHAYTCAHTHCSPLITHVSVLGGARRSAWARPPSAARCRRRTGAPRPCMMRPRPRSAVARAARSRAGPRLRRRRGPGLLRRRRRPRCRAAQCPQTGRPRSPRRVCATSAIQRRRGRKPRSGRLPRCRHRRQRAWCARGRRRRGGTFEAGLCQCAGGPGGLPRACTPGPLLSALGGGRLQYFTCSWLTVARRLRPRAQTHTAAEISLYRTVPSRRQG